MKELNKQLIYIQENLNYLDEYALNHILSEINLAIVKKETLFRPQDSGKAVYRRDESFDFRVTNKKDLLKQAADFEKKIFGDELTHREYNFIGYLDIYKNSDKKDTYYMPDNYGVPSLCKLLYYIQEEDVNILEGTFYNIDAVNEILKDLYTSDNKDKFRFQLPNTEFIIEKFKNGNITISGWTDKQKDKFEYMINLHKKI